MEVEFDLKQTALQLESGVSTSINVYFITGWNLYPHIRLGPQWVGKSCSLTKKHDSMWCYIRGFAFTFVNS
jgi:hypothetical protein